MEWSRQRTVALLAGTLYLFAINLGGCTKSLEWPAPRVAQDFQQAESLQYRTGKPLLLVFLDSRSTVDKPMKRAMADPQVRGRLKELVECRLFRVNEDDRRYAAQFKVERAPSLILVHPDGTYHSYEATPSPSAILKFLDESQSVGQQPTRNSLIQRAPRYAWQTDLESALSSARESNRDALLVLYRGGTRDWSRIEKMLDRPEVFRRFGSMVHARVTGLIGAPKDVMSRFGVTALPAIVIVRTDGSSEKLELPTSFETIIQFADAARNREHQGVTSSMTSAAPEPAPVQP